MPAIRPVLLLALLTPAATSAGPIGWGYSVAASYAQDYGPRFSITLSPDGTVTATPGQADFVSLFTSTGVARPDPGNYEVQCDFDITVTLTDLASGQSAALTFTGGYESQWSYPPGTDPDLWRWDSESSIFGSFWEPRGVVLGTTRYTVRAYGGDHGRFPFGEMAVTAESLPGNTTPEPGTLGLVAVGLAGVALRRFRPNRGEG